MTSRLRFATDHVALVTGDTARTVEFYTRVMGWPLVGAWRSGDREGRDRVISAFDGDRWRLEFEEVAGRPAPQPQAPGFPHIGLDVGTPEEYERWKAHLRGCDVPYLEVREGNCFFSDPNGLSFQLVVKSAVSAFEADTDAAPEDVVNAWIRDRAGEVAR